MAEECGCTVVIRRSGVDRIDYCPVHAAAAQLRYAVALASCALLPSQVHNSALRAEAYRTARAALAAAEGRDA